MNNLEHLLGLYRVTKRLIVVPLSGFNMQSVQEGAVISFLSVTKSTTGGLAFKALLENGSMCYVAFGAVTTGELPYVERL